MALSWVTPDFLLQAFEPAPAEAAWPPALARHRLPPVCRPAQEVQDLMTRDLATIGSEVTVTRALHLMAERGFRHLPVLKGSRLVGILSDRDVLRFVHRPETPVATAMTRKLWTAACHTPILTAARLMAEHHVGCLPVVDERGDLVGILSASDVLRCLSYHAPVQAWL